MAVMWFSRIWVDSERNGASRKATIAASRDMVAATVGAMGGEGEVKRSLLLAGGRRGMVGARVTAWCPVSSTSSAFIWSPPRFCPEREGAAPVMGRHGRLKRGGTLLTALFGSF